MTELSEFPRPVVGVPGPVSLVLSCLVKRCSRNLHSISATPGQYQGPAKARAGGGFRGDGRRDDRYGGGSDRYGGGRRDDRRDGGYGGSMAAPMRSDNRYDDRRGGPPGGYPDRRDDRPRYDDRDRRDYGRREGGGGDRRERDYERRY